MRKKKVTLIISDRRGLLMGRPGKVARSLASNGYIVKILTWDRSRSSPEFEKINGCEVHDFRFKPPNFGRWSLFFSYLIWWGYISLFLLKDDADLYHVENFQSLIPVIPIKIARRKLVVYDIADFLADSLKWPGLVRKFLARLERLCLRFADGVIITGEHRRGQIDRASIRKLAIIMNCPSDLVRECHSTRNGDKFTIYCGGLILETRGFRQICQAIQNLKDVKLIIAGFGPDEEKLMAVFKAQENVEFKGLLSSEESLQWTSRADVLFAFYDPRVPLNRLASPSKLFDSMMCGKPIILNSEAVAVAQIIKKEKCGLLVAYDDIAGLRSTIEKLRDDAGMRAEMGQNGKRAFEREYNWAEMEARLLKLYDAVLARD